MSPEQHADVIRWLAANGSFLDARFDEWWNGGYKRAQRYGQGRYCFLLYALEC